MSASASPAPARPRRAGPYALLERPTSAMLLALVSGVLDAWTFARVGTFATVQSGNVVMLGFFGVQGDAERALRALAAVLAFGLGAGLCAVAVALVLARGRAYSPWVLLVEALALVVCAVLVATRPALAAGVVLAVSLLAGVQGNAFHRDHGMLYGNTAVTFVVQTTFSLLGRAVVRRRVDDGDPHVRIAAVFGLVLVAFAAGGAAGFVLESVWSPAPLLAAAVVVLGLGLAAARARGPVDPEQTAPTP